MNADKIIPGLRNTWNPLKPIGGTKPSLWLSALAITGLVDGDAVASWLDRSGNGNHAVQVSGPAQPLYKIINGHPYVRFDGIDDTLVTGSFLNAGFNTAMTVYTLAPTRQAAQHVVCSNSITKFYVSDWVVGGMNANDYYTSQLSNTEVHTTYPNNPTAIANPRMVAAWSYNGSVVLRGQNGRINSQATTGALGLSGALTIGHLDTSTYWWLGDISDILVYNAAHNAAQIRQVSAFLARKSSIPMVDRHYAFVGDSRTMGTGSQTSSSYPAMVMSLLGNPGNILAYNYGYSSRKVATMITNAALSHNLARMNTETNDVCVVFGGLVDHVVDVVDAATIYSRLQTLCAAKKTLGYSKVYVCSEIDANTGAGNYVTWHSTVWSALNALLRANTSWCDGLIDIGADARLQDATNTIYFDADKIHLNDAGYAVIAAAVKAKIAGG